MQWQKVVLRRNQIAAGEHMKLQTLFEDLFTQVSHPLMGEVNVENNDN
jgi:hypothetical protein